MNKKIYIVGGYVRDMVLNQSLPLEDRIKSNDIDYVAEGYTEEDFSHLKRVGVDFPVFLSEEGHEIALARDDVNTGNGYNDFECITEGTSVLKDLGRRDLTFNAMAIDPDTDEIIDPYDGIGDIVKKVLRHVSERFAEDPLRVLRLARFAARFPDFKIHKSTKLLVRSMRESLKSLQRDRVWKEVEKVMKLKHSHKFFEVLFELGVLDIVFPNIYELTRLKEGSKHHEEGSVFIHTMMVMKQIEELTTISELELITLKIASLYHDIAKPICYETYGNSAGHDDIDSVRPRLESDMSIPNKYKKNALFLISNHIRLFRLHEMSARKIASFLERYRRNVALFNMQILLGDADSNGRVTFTVKRMVESEKLMSAFNKVVKFSPKHWIDSKEIPPSDHAIKQYVHSYNIGVVKEILM